MSDSRRSGDQKDIYHQKPLTWWPAREQPLRLLPRHGDPHCLIEWLAQNTLKLIAYPPAYVLLVLMLLVVVQLYNPL